MKTRGLLLPSLLLLSASLLSSGALAQSRKKTKKKRDPVKLAQSYVARLKKGRLTDEKRERYFKALQKLGKSAEGALTKGWRGLEEKDACRALGLLGKLSTKRARAAILSACSDLRVEVRATSAQLLGRMPPSTNATAVLSRLLGDADDEVTQAALVALAQQPSVDSYRVMLRAIKEHGATKGWPRRLASRVLGSGLGAIFTAARAEELLGACASADDDEVREALFSALSQSDPKKAAPYMLRALESYAPKGMGGPIRLPAPGDVRSSAEHLFRKGAPLLPLHESMAALAVQSVGRLRNPKLFPLLMRCLRSEGPLVRLATLGVIQMTIPNAAGHDALIAAVIMRLTDRDHRVSQQAYAWLRRVTRQNISLSFSRWSAWLKASKEDQLQDAVAAIAGESGFETVEDFLEDGGYQFLGDYLADGGRETVQAYLDQQLRKRSPARNGEYDPNERR